MFNVGRPVRAAHAAISCEPPIQVTVCAMPSVRSASIDDQRILAAANRHQRVLAQTRRRCGGVAAARGRETDAVVQVQAVPVGELAEPVDVDRFQQGRRVRIDRVAVDADFGGTAAL